MNSPIHVLLQNAFSLLNLQPISSKDLKLYIINSFFHFVIDNVLQFAWEKELDCLLPFRKDSHSNLSTHFKLGEGAGKKIMV